MAVKRWTGPLFALVVNGLVCVLCVLWHAWVGFAVNGAVCLLAASLIVDELWRAWRGIHKRAHSGVGGGAGADGAALARAGVLSPSEVRASTAGIAPYFSGSLVGTGAGASTRVASAHADIRFRIREGIGGAWTSGGITIEVTPFRRWQPDAFGESVTVTFTSDGAGETFREERGWRLRVHADGPASLTFRILDAQLPLRQMGKLTDYVIGWRYWEWQREETVFDGRAVRTFPAALRSINAHFGTWLAGENRAACQKDSTMLDVIEGRHRPPEADCDCGFYLRRSAREAGIGCSPFDAPALGATGFVWGAVRCSGRIIEHGPEGFRAEHVEIVALVDYGETARAAAKRYGVPCLGAEHIEPYAYEFGRALPGPEA